MDMTKMELIRIPFATVLFIASVLVLWNINQFIASVMALWYIDGLDAVLHAIIPFLCIVMLVYSMVLYSHLDMPTIKH